MNEWMIKYYFVEKWYHRLLIISFFAVRYFRFSVVFFIYHLCKWAMSDERWICVHNKCCDRNRFACIFILLLNENTPFSILSSFFWPLSLYLVYIFFIFWRWMAKRVNYSCLSSLVRSKCLLLFLAGLMRLQRANAVSYSFCVYILYVPRLISPHNENALLQTDANGLTYKNVHIQQIIAVWRMAYGVQHVYRVQHIQM